MENSKNLTEDEQKQVALFKFSLIAPLVNGCHASNSKMDYFRSVAEKEHKMPSGKNVYLSPLTIKSWYLSYTHGGFDALFPKVRNDFKTTRKLNLESENRILELKQNFPHITGKAVYEKLIEENVINQKDTSIATVYRFLRNNSSKNQNTVERRSFEMEHANDCWQCDTSHGPVITINGKKVQTYLIQIIDDASRLIVGGKLFLNDNAINFQSVLKHAIKVYGIPKKKYLLIMVPHTKIFNFN